MKLKLAVIGIGMAWDKLHQPALAQLGDCYEIVAMCDTEIEKARGAAAALNLPAEQIYSDHRQLLQQSDVEVVLTLVPISENFEVARDVILTGKDLIAEKPLAATLEGAKELIALKNQHGTKMLVAENFRYEEFCTVIKEIITSGQIGEVAYFILNTAAGFEQGMTGDSFSAKEWRQHPNFAGGIFLDGGVHDMALMRCLFGEAEEVKALGTAQSQDYCPWRNINAVIKFAGGVVGSYNFWSPHTELAEPPIGLRIFGSLGEIVLESKDCGVVRVYYRNGGCEQKNFTPNRGFYNELRGFYDGEIVSTPEKELGDMELVFKVVKALEGD